MEKPLLQAWLNGDILSKQFVVRQVKLIGLIVVLIFVYILVGYLSLKQQRYLADLHKQVKDAKMTYLAVSAEVLEHTRQSYVASQLAEQGSDVQENRIPPVKL